jgi:hypothetical protein
MTTPHDVVPAPESLSLPPQSDDEIIAFDSSQEINERRARVENTELLQHLRGL